MKKIKLNFVSNPSVGTRRVNSDTNVVTYTPGCDGEIQCIKSARINPD